MGAAQLFFQEFFHDLLGLSAIIFIIVLIYFASQRFPRNQGRQVKFHLIYVVVTVLSFFLPMAAKERVFTPLTVVIAGTVYPIYESLRAVCTLGSTDDTVWLTYWICQGLVSFTTQWVDGIGENVQVHWNMFEFFFYVWLLLPWTDGAALAFDFILEPLVGPVIQPIVNKMDGVINKIILALTNAAHLSIVWVAFVFLDPTFKRVVWIMIGTVFPMFSSMVSVTTPEGADDTYWLTYWSCFGILFIITDFIEGYLGAIPGFYTLVIAMTIYLMLPLFRGADVVSVHSLCRNSLKFRFTLSLF